MAEKTEFLQALQDASLDADSLEQFINGDDTQDVLTRLSKQYPTLQKALKQINIKISEANNQLQTNLDNADQALVDAKAQLKVAIDDLFKNGGLPATPFETLDDMQSSLLEFGEYAYVLDDVDSNNGLYYKAEDGWVRSKYDVYQFIDAKYKELRKDVSDEIDRESNKYIPPAKGVYADFINNVYAIDGELCEFDDIFELQRPSEAWLSTENGLKSFKPNEPRLQDGLVIEPAITNKLTMQSVLNGYNSNGFETKRIMGDFNSEVRISYEPTDDSATSSGSFVPGAPDNTVLGSYTGGALRSITVRKGDSQFVSIDDGFGSVVMDTQSGEVAYKNTRTASNPEIAVTGQWITLYFVTVVSPTTDSMYRIGFGSEHDGEGVLTTRKHDSIRVSNAVFAAFVYKSKHPILAINSQTTKSGEKLVCKQDVLSVAGEWDSTLSVSHTEGALTISGSGVIKKIHINSVSIFDWKSEAIAFWDFKEPSAPYKATYGVEEFPLNDGGLTTKTVTEGPFGNALEIASDKYLIIPSDNVGGLNIAKKGNEVSVVAWVRRKTTGTNFVAGMWQEDDADPRRQYGLFIHLPTYDGAQGVCGHISKTGRPTPGYPYATEYSASLRAVPVDTWQTIGFTYDGQQAISYLQGWADQKPNKNPLFFNGGLNNNSVSDFTVGATKISSGMTHFATGLIGGVAVFDRALSSHEMMQIHKETLGKDNVVWSLSFDKLVNPSTSIESVYGGKTYTSESAVRTRTDLFFAYNFQEFYDSWGYPIAVTKIGDIKFLFTRGSDQSAVYTVPKIGVIPTYDGFLVRDMSIIQAKFNNENVNTPTRFVVIVDGVWYVHSVGLGNEVAAVSGTDWSNAEELSVSTKGQVWNIATVKENTELSISAELVSLPASGHVEYIGIYTYRIHGHIRISDLIVLSS